MSTSPQRIELGIDWLASSYPADETDDSGLWHEALSLAEELSEQGETVREGQLLGYRGIYVGRLFVGQRDDGTFVRATGAFALEAFERLYVEQMSVSRLDLQVTAWFPGNSKHIGTSAAMLAEKHNKALPAARRRKITQYTNSEGGHTLYIGSRTSEHYCRLYNKFAESKQEIYRDAWRFEVELHNKSAKKVADGLLGLPGEMKPYILSTIRSYYQERGVELPWAYSHATPLSYAVDRHETDDERSITWLSTQVRPTVARLLARGYTTDVLVSLGLEHLFGLKANLAEEEAI